jgi:hypothetical protein
MPEASRMKSEEECGLGARVPAAISAAWAAFQRSAWALKAATSSSLVMTASGVKTPVPVMAALCMVTPFACPEGKGVGRKRPA